MIKKLHKQFVVTAMIAISILLIAFVNASNIMNYISTNNQSNKMLERIAMQEINSFGFKVPNISHTPPNDIPKFLRYFTVKLDSNGEISELKLEKSPPVNAEYAAVAAKYAKGRTKGKYQEFKFSLTKLDDNSELIVFLDTSNELNTLSRVFAISMAIFVISWLIMLLIVIPLSKKAIKPIAENIEKQKQFITNAGHELKTPLSIILANTDAMELYNGKNKWSINIRAQVQRLSGLMQNMLTLAKADESGIDFPKTEFCISDAIDSALQTFKESISIKNIKFDIDIKPKINVYANRENIVQIANILIDNAVKYTDGYISVTLETDGHKAVFSILNTCTVTEDNPEKMFERFYRGDSSRTQKNGGYGIGLSAARALAKTNGGTLTAHYKNDNSIIFILSL